MLIFLWCRILVSAGRGRGCHVTTGQDRQCDPNVAGPWSFNHGPGPQLSFNNGPGLSFNSPGSHLTALVRWPRLSSNNGPGSSFNDPGCHLTTPMLRARGHLIAGPGCGRPATSTAPRCFAQTPRTRRAGPDDGPHASTEALLPGPVLVAPPPGVARLPEGGTVRAWGGVLSCQVGVSCRLRFLAPATSSTPSFWLAAYLACGVPLSEKIAQHTQGGTSGFRYPDRRCD